MQTQRRYVVRLYVKGRGLTGILEDAHTGAEIPFRNARELVSLFCKAGMPSSQPALPTSGVLVTDLSAGTSSSPPHRDKKEDKK